MFQSANPYDLETRVLVALGTGAPHRFSAFSRSRLARGQSGESLASLPTLGQSFVPRCSHPTRHHLAIRWLFPPVWGTSHEGCRCHQKLRRRTQEVEPYESNSAARLGLELASRSSRRSFRTPVSAATVAAAGDIVAQRSCGRTPCRAYVASTSGIIRKIEETQWTRSKQMQHAKDC